MGKINIIRNPLIVQVSYLLADNVFVGLQMNIMYSDLGKIDL